MGPMEKVGLMFLLLAYSNAVTRFITGGESAGILLDRAQRHDDDPATPDPSDDPVSASDLYLALRAALAASRPVDRRLSELLGGGDWWTRMERERTPPDRLTPRAVPAMRYARNAVEHDDADLIAFEHGEPRNRGRRIPWECIWADFRASRTTGMEAYRAELLGESISTTLAGVGAVYLGAAIRPEIDPVDLK